MRNLDEMFGRTGNRMFQTAYMYAKFLDKELPDIYVQAPKYFDHHREEIKRLFGQGITPINKVAIHVRRGDYVFNEFYVDLSKTDYYEVAMKEFPKETFLIFSDDIAWCRRQPLFRGMEFSANNSEVEDMNAMAGCKGIIMANSSYSWWAAYLNCGKVVAPSVEHWYTDGIERTRCLPEWIRL